MKTIAKISLALFTFHSSVGMYSIQSDEYLEDQDLYSSSNMQELSGWNWSVNQAHAELDDSPTETITVTGQRIYNYYSSLILNYTYGGYGGGAGGGGGAGSQPPNTGNGNGGQQQEQEQELDAEALQDAIATMLQLKNEINKELNKLGLDADDLKNTGFKDMLDKFDRAISKANLLLTAINTGSQTAAHLAQEEYALAVSEVVTAMISLGVGSVVGFFLGGPVGVVAGAAAGLAIENIVDSLTVAAAAQLMRVHGNAALQFSHLSDYISNWIWTQLCYNQLRTRGHCNIPRP